MKSSEVEVVEELSGSKDGKRRRKRKLNETETGHRRLCVWRTGAEWHHVAKLLASASLDDLRSAINWISVWKLRSKQLPMAVIVTEYVFLPHLMDGLVENNTTDIWLHRQNLTMAYCTGIVRFVNYLNELGQTGRSVMPVHVAVEKHGIPKWIVELRHKATHQQLPSLEQLRLAGNFCRHWLMDNYWSQPLNDVPSVSSLWQQSLAQQQPAAKLRRLMDIYTAEYPETNTDTTATRLKTLKDLLEEMNGTALNTTGGNSPMWKTNEGEADWNQIPFGYLPGQTAAVDHFIQPHTVRVESNNS